MKRLLAVLAVSAMLIGCDKIPPFYKEKPPDSKTIGYLMIVGVDDEHGVVCYSHSNNSIGISCVKVK
jgi:hypothetical protein